MWLMQIVVDQIQPGTAGKVRHMSDIVGGKVTLLWLKSFDADAMGGRGSITMTDLREDAMQFDSLGHAAEQLEAVARNAMRLSQNTPHRVTKVRLVTFTTTEGTRQ